MATLTTTCWAWTRDGIATDPLGVLSLETDSTNTVSADFPDGTKIISVASAGAGHNCALGAEPDALTTPTFHVPDGGERDIRVTKRALLDLKVAAVAI